MKHLKFILYLFVFAASFATTPLFAQDAPGQVQPTSLIAEQQNAVTNLAAKTDVVERAVKANPEDDDILVQARTDLEALYKPILDVGLAFRPRLAEINSELEQLGAPPKDGEAPEAADKEQKRAALTKEKQQINAVTGKAEDLQVHVNDLMNKIAGMRSTLFGRMLFKRYDLETTITSQVGREIDSEAVSFWRSIKAWFDFVWRYKSQAFISATFLSLVLALAANWLGRRLLGRLIIRKPDDDPSYLRRLGVAFWSTVLPVLAFGMFSLLIVGLFAYFNVLRGLIGEYLNGALGVAFTTFFVNRLAHAALAPTAPAWRLVPIEPAPARLLIWLATMAAMVVGLDSFLSMISSKLGSPLSVTIVKSLVAAVLVGILLVLIARVKPFVDEQGKPQPWPRWFRTVLYILAAATIFAALGGYISLAQFISRQVVVTGAWLATAYIGLRASQAISEEGGFARTRLGRWYKERRNADDAALDQLGVLTSIVINVLIVMTFLPYVLFQWGYKPADIAVWMNRLGTGIQIGSFTFSPLAILTGLLVFTIGYFLTRWFQSWLDGTVMARGRVDTGVRNSIKMIVGYAGLALAALVAISAAGLDLSNLALIAGGLSLGIGFGLQNIVSNFVSGLILLVERPFKTGDWVVAGDVSGIVKKISVRATEIETFQRQSVIMPNSVLINGAVRNWTHRNKIGRVDITVGVIYDTDPAIVFQTLKDIARSHPMVLKNPEPFVLLGGFSEKSVDFEVRVFLGDITNGSVVQNDIRVAILSNFRQQGIIIAHAPYVQGAPIVADTQVEDESAPEHAAGADASEQLPKSKKRGARPDPD